MSNTLEIKMWPAGITGSGVTGISAAVLVVVIVLFWLTATQTPFVF
jgi:hypothetical protein